MGNLKTARILVSGNVQGVGFRAYVEQIARGMQIKGFVRNLDDGKVEIYAQANKEKINAFAKRIGIKGSPSDPFSLNVTKTQVVFEHNKNFIRPDRALGLFEVDYGEESNLQKEMVKKAAIATFMMHSLNSKTDSFRQETSHNFKRLENTLGGKTDSFRQETSSNFNKLDNKYGNISKAMGSINGNIKKNNRILSKIAGVLSKA